MISNELFSLNYFWTTSSSLTCGTTWHSAGLAGQIRNFRAEMELSKYSVQLYKQFEERGDSVGE